MRNPILIQPDLSLAEVRALAAMLGPNAHACGLVTERKVMEWLGTELAPSPSLTPPAAYRIANQAVQALSAELRDAVAGGDRAIAAIEFSPTDLRLVDLAARFAIANEGSEAQVQQRYGMDRRRIAHLRTTLALDGHVATALAETGAWRSQRRTQRMVAAARAMRRARPNVFPADQYRVTAPERLLLEDALNLVQGRPMNSQFRGDVDAACAAFREQCADQSIDLRAAAGGLAPVRVPGTPVLGRSFIVARQM